MKTVLFLCRPDVTYIDDESDKEFSNKELIEHAKVKFSSGQYFNIIWSCGNSEKIEVGDRAYLQSVSCEPHGFIGAGYVVPAPKEQQLKLHSKKYSHLSAAYVNLDDRNYVSINLDSVVDFDFPLEQKKLARLPQFQGVNFLFQSGGCQFDPQAAPYLDNEWETHSLIMQGKGRGRRLVDIFCERGQNYSQKKAFQEALNAYQMALRDMQINKPPVIIMKI